MVLYGYTSWKAVVFLVLASHAKREVKLIKSQKSHSLLNAENSICLIQVEAGNGKTRYISIVHIPAMVSPVQPLSRTCCQGPKTVEVTVPAIMP